MGLDISAYTKLTLLPNISPDAEWKDGQVHISQAIIDWVEKEWLGRTAGLKAGVYSYEDNICFRAGSYGGYGEWRNELAQRAHGMPVKNIWAGEHTKDTAFFELLQFADNEGYIGPAISKKLHQDFVSNRERIIAGADEYFISKYDEWTKAFALASDGGCVDFH